MADFRFTKRVAVPAAELGLNGVLLTAITDSSWIGVDGYPWVRVTHDLTRTAATDVTYNVELKDAEGTVTLLQTVSVASGVATYSDYQHKKTVAASKKWSTTLSIAGAAELRIIDVTGTSASTDTIIMKLEKLS